MTRSRTPTYDLALPPADYEQWEGPPKRSIVICSHPRSGSTLLGEALYFSGDQGCPLEYLHRGFRPNLAALWGSASLSDYVAQLHRRRTCSNGNFAIKVFWQDLEDVAHEMAPDRFPMPLTSKPNEASPAYYQSLQALFATILPNPIFVYLVRADRVRQAISAITAVQTGLWRSIPGVGRQAPIAPADYDFDRIMAAIALGDHCHGHWRRFFDANSVLPHALTYEDLVGNYEAVVGALLRQLGSASQAAPPRRMQRQADDTNEAMVLQFLGDYAKRTSP